MSNYGYDESNLVRAFPFVANDKTAIPDWLVVDFRALIIDGDYDPEIHSIWLAWVGRLANKVRLGFRTDAPDLADEELVFELDINTGEFVTAYADSSPNTVTIEDRCGCDTQLFCDTEFVGDTQCGPELLCDPRFDETCGDNLICDITDSPS